MSTDPFMRPWKVKSSGKMPPEIVSDASPFPIVDWSGFDNSHRSMRGHHIAAQLIVSCVNAVPELRAEVEAMRDVLKNCLGTLAAWEAMAKISGLTAPLMHAGTLESVAVAIKKPKVIRTIFNAAEVEREFSGGGGA